MECALAHRHATHFLAVFAHHMGRASQAGVKTVQGTQDFQGLLGVDHGRVHQAGLEGADLALGVARAAVPGGRHHALVVLDAAVLDADPVTERAARCFGKAGAHRFLRPRFVDGELATTYQLWWRYF